MALTRAEKTPRRVPEEERQYLAKYRPGDYPRPSVAVDIVVLTIVDAELRVLLARRKEHPFKDHWGLPGGFVRVGDAHKDQGEDLDAAAARELEEETGLKPQAAYLEQLKAFGRSNRDPRMRVISIAYFALVRPDLVPLVRAGGDVSDVNWFAVSGLSKVPLAFDHAEIIETALAHVRENLDKSPLAFNLVPATFTIPELRVVHEIISGTPQDPGNFRRKFNRMLEDGVIEKAPGKRITVSKPATVYRFVKA